MEERLVLKTLSELKHYCKTLGLKSGGNKDSLIRLIVQYIYTTNGRMRAEGIIPADILSIYDTSLAECTGKSIDPSQIKCYCTGEKLGLIKCCKCMYYLHLQCVGLTGQIKNYICPKCIIEKISPLDLPKEYLITPWYCRETNSSSMAMFQSTEKKINYSQELYELIIKAKGDLQVQIRCIKTNSEPCMTWPKKGYLLVNGKIAMKFETSANANAKKRKDEPLNLTTILNPGANTINLIQNHDPATYVVALLVVYQKKEEELISEIQEKNWVSIEKSKEFASNILNSDDNEVITDSIKFLINCPISKTPIEIPARGADCKHIQCFDLARYIFLQRFSKVNRWKCPLCTNYVYDIVVDLFVSDIVRQAKSVDDHYAVEILKDLTFKIITLSEFLQTNSENPDLPKKRPDLKSLETSQKPIRSEEIINIDD